MQRAMVAVISCLSLGLLYAGQRPAPVPAEGALSQVDAAPVSWSAPVEDPAVEALMVQFRARHTGLSDPEIRELAALLIRESERNGLDPDLVLAVMQVESSCYNFAVSSVGALGLMQIMPGTGEVLAARHGVEWHGPDTLFDPIVNVTLGIAYLRQLTDRFGSLPAALAAYNWGPARIDSRLRRGAALPSKYVQQVLQVYDVPGDVQPRRS